VKSQGVHHEIYKTTGSIQLKIEILFVILNEIT